MKRKDNDFAAAEDAVITSWNQINAFPYFAYKLDPAIESLSSRHTDTRTRQTHSSNQIVLIVAFE